MQSEALIWVGWDGLHGVLVRVCVGQYISQVNQSIILCHFISYFFRIKVFDNYLFYILNLIPYFDIVFRAFRIVL